MRVLVTGGAGFIGSTIVDALEARGDLVVVVDDISTGDRANLAPDIALRVADVSDTKALRAAVHGEGFDAVVHCASRTKVVESMEKPDLYRRVIVEGTRNVVRLQTGYLYHYAFAMLIGAAALITWFMFAGLR